MASASTQGFPLQVPSPLPPVPGKDVLSPEQWNILAALADAFCPSLTKTAGNALLQQPLRAEKFDVVAQRIEDLAQEDGRDGLVVQYLEERASSNPEFKETVFRVLACYLDSGARSNLLFLLSTLR